MCWKQILRKAAIIAVPSALAGVLTFSAGAQVVATSIPHNHIYPTVNASPGNIHAAIIQASREHKRVILDFGGDWCPDCQVLNIYFNQSPNRELMDKYFVRVNVNIGHQDANVDIAHHYGVPLTGVPALAVLDSHGKLLYAQNEGVLEICATCSLLTSRGFLNKWKP